MWRHIKLFIVFLKVSLQDDAAYRSEFWMRILSTLYSLAIAAVALWIIFSNTNQVAGWSLEQVIVLIGTYHTVAGVVRAVFAPNFQRLVEHVREGTLDFLLTKPGNSQFLASFRRIAIFAGAESILGLIVVGIGVSRLSGAEGVHAAIAFPFALASGLVLLYSFWLFIVTFVFWFVRLDNLPQIFWSLFEAARYPLEIYPGWLRGVVTYLVPVGVVVTVPARGITGYLQLTSLAAFAAFAAVALWAASRFWRFGIGKYTSASS